MSFEDFQKQVNEARTICEETRASLKTARQKAGSLKRKKEQLLRRIGIEDRERDPHLAEIAESEGKFAESVCAGKAAYAEALGAERAIWKEFLHFTDPIKNVASLMDDWPILLFPLRLETRFKKVERNGAQVNQLWVRVFPDDIAINSFESDLSDTEIRNARAYWLARWKVGKNDVNGNRGAWRSLASAHGPGRAYWLTNNYVPTNYPASEPEKAEGEIILSIGTETVLVEPELGAIVAYWQAMWQAKKDVVRQTQAWENLLLVVSEERAATLVKDFKPANINDPPPTGRTRDKTIVRVEFVIFPATDEMETKLHAWSQPPTTSILPERFVFLAFQGGKPAMAPQLGNLVPSKLILGPDPAAEPGEDLRLASKEDADTNPNIHEGDLLFSENMRWMFDFDEAVAKGMGFKIDLSPEQAAIGFDRVFVLGLKLGADKDKGQNLLEELFEQHQYSRKGLAIIKQGTPTNNTEEDGSGYSWKHDPDDSFNIYFNEATPRPDPADWFGKTDGRWLAEMLGIDPAKLQAVENYYSTDIAEAKSMQRAMWPATLGHFMDSMMNPVFSKSTVELTREFFTQFVSGRGNLPAIRVGKQPYGILPATDYTHMQWFMPQSQDHHLLSSTAAIFDWGKLFLPTLYRILLDMDLAWTLLQSRVAHAGKKGDSHQILLDIVGLHPDSVELHQRFANSLRQIHNIYNAKAFEHDDLAKWYENSIAAAAALLARYGYTIGAKNPEPDIFKKSFYEKSFLLGGNRIDKVPNSEIDPIGIWTDNTKNYIGWLIEAAQDSHDRLRLQDGFIDDKPPTTMLYLLLHHALDLSYIDIGLKLCLNRGVMTQYQVQQAYIEPDMIHIKQDQETESRWRHLYTRDVRVTDDQDITLGQYIPQHMDILNEAAAFRNILAGLRQLENVPTASLERLLMEHLDTVSYRYDAWMLGYLHLQLAIMRGQFTAEPAPPDKRGVYIGAYGWLEDVRPENKVLAPVQLPDDLNELFNPEGDLVEDASNAGYILAPSQNHAVTAAVLRNGHLSNDDPEEKEELKIKLSSERVRLALKIIEGVQGGQTLSALLGYQFERGLHDRTDAEVDEFIYDLRNSFPLVAKKLKDTVPGTEDPEYESIDQIEAKNVLDGIAFLEHIEKTGARTYPFGLGLPHASDTQKSAINQEVLKLIEANDAVADLALAESVHQVVLGNYERAAATLDTYSKGNFPPAPDVIQTPRSGTQLTHRVALQFRTGLSHTLHDPGVTPRMVAEPAIHNWLSQIMPAMNKIECVVGYVDRIGNTDREVPVNLSDIGLAHIDLLYLLNIDSEQAMSALDDRIVQHILTNYTPRMDRPIHIEYTRAVNTDKFNVFELTSLIASLRAMLLSSKALTAADVKLSNEAAKEDEQSLSLVPARIIPIITALNDLRTTTLATYLADLDSIIAAADVNNIVEELDTLMSGMAALLSQAGEFGLPQTGTGFLYQWHQSMYTQLRAKVEELIARWDSRIAEYIVLRDRYMAGIGVATEDELFAILREAEFVISTTPTVPSLDTPADQFVAVNAKFVQFENLFNTVLLPTLDLHSLTELLQKIGAMAPQLPPFDSVGIDIQDQLKQVNIFAGDLKIRSDNLSQEMANRETKAGNFLAGMAGTSDALAKVELVKSAAKAIFGDDFVIVPEFTLNAAQGTEWQNTVADSDVSLRYLRDDLDMDFPMDNWLYGVSRVREKLHHLENTLIHVEGFNGPSLTLVPSQFPYRENDYWLGMQFPAKKLGTEEPFTIDEDKLLFTSIYAEDFNPTRPQCGLLLDEWTEVIPSRDETAGLTFHYDQPNSEPPQALLLVTPSSFTGHWRWNDLVQTLHETIDMAKKRAVEPDHIDTTIYSHFLPPIVSLASPLPLTAMLNLSINNLVAIAEVFDNE